MSSPSSLPRGARPDTARLVADHARPDERAQPLWDRYLADPSPQLRDVLVLVYAPLVKFVASRLASRLPPDVDRADLTSHGLFGLLDAIGRYDPERGRFSTFAVPRIRGAILDALRSEDWVPRTVRVKQRKIADAIATFESAHHRTPSDAELAQTLGWEDRQLTVALTELSVTTVPALDQTIELSDGGPVRLADTVADAVNLAPDQLADAAEELRLLRQTLTDLPERDRAVLTMYYYEGMTLRQIGDVLGVTESRVCQIHTKSVMALRGKLERQLAH